MRNMKDSGIPWIGEIPEDWICSEQRFQIKLINGRAYKDSEFEKNGKYKVLRVGNLFSNPIWYSSSLELPEENYCSDGDLLYSWSMSYAPVIWKGEKVIYHYHIWKVKLIGNLARDFTYFYLIALTDALMAEVHETTMGFITMGIMNKSYIAVPPLKEQRKIAIFLKSKSNQIDRIIQKQQDLIDKLKAYKQSLITETVTRGLDPSVPMKDSGIPWIGKIPISWSVASIQHLHNGLTDGTHGTYRRLNSGRLLLSSKNVRENGLRISDNESYISESDYKSIVANGFPQKGDVLLCCIGASIGRCTVYNYDEIYAFQRSVIFIRPGNKVISDFLMYALKSESSLIQETFLVNQSAQAGLYQGLVSKIRIPVPKIREQNIISKFLDKKCTQIDADISKRQQLIDKLKEYKKSLIYEVVTGKREVE
ncbi:restriction endonuclease subunit S [Dialister sp.]|uniref:restriction endonuclease subunit S n=1 Tax=Dialister sp. TaxID=1955814 RepID=UPI002E81E37F|nr:restriction endonuclease subunit S [Dialister sp.]MEE3453362.1 restriction endonuclease subunit S [Dialister sp.]